MAASCDRVSPRYIRTYSYRIIQSVSPKYLNVPHGAKNSLLEVRSEGPYQKQKVHTDMRQPFDRE